MPLIDHPLGNYRFLPGIAPYSCGVASAPGYELVHVTLERPEPYLRGFELVYRHLEEEGRPIASLCAMELRSPKPFTFAGFAEFNGKYAEILKSLGLFVDGMNPVARTNVAPEIGAPSEPSLYAFTYTRPCHPGLSPTFVVAGAGELPEGVLERDGIVRLGDTSPEGLAAKAEFVLDLMENRIKGLGASWPDTTAIDVYTIHSMDRIQPEQLLKRAGAAGIHGIRWFYTRPPIEEIEYEMDVRGVRAEFRL